MLDARGASAKQSIQGTFKKKKKNGLLRLDVSDFINYSTAVDQGSGSEAYVLMLSQMDNGPIPANLAWYHFDMESLLISQ